MATRWLLLVGLLLIVVPPVAAPLAAQAAEQPLSAYERGQTWFSRDKAYHLTLSAAGAAGTYALGRAIGLERWQAALASAVLTGTVGFLRESWDFEDPSNRITRQFFSRRDMVWNGVGIVIGISAADLFW